MNKTMKTLATVLTGVALVGAGSGIASAASPAENQAAQTAFQNDLATATAVGAFGGTAAGAAIGCAIGAGVGVVATAAALSLPGCIAMLPTGATVGGVVGTIVAGGPTLVLSGIDLLQTQAAAPNTTKWAAPAA